MNQIRTNNLNVDIMGKKVGFREIDYERFVEYLGDQIARRFNNSHLVVLLGLRTGGECLSETLESYLLKQGINVRRLVITVRPEEEKVEGLEDCPDYLRDSHIIGVDDALWKGNHLRVLSDYMERNREKFGYTDFHYAVIFDSLHQADFYCMQVPQRADRDSNKSI